MTDVKFLRGLASQYAALQTKDDKTFYYATDTHKLYLGGYELTTKDEIQTAVNLVNNGTKGNEALYAEITKLEGDASTEGSIAYLLAALKTTIEGEVVNSISAGNNGIVIDNTTATAPTVGLKLSSKTGNALSIETGSGEEGLYVTIPSQTDYTVSITETAGGSGDAYSKRYTIKQGATGSQTTLGNIDIPKDMVVESGSVVDITYDATEGKLYEGQTDVTEAIKGTDTPTAADAGKYIKLIIANSSSTALYIPAKSLVDIYTAQQNATQIQLAIDANNVISATVVAGSIGTTELSTAVNTSLGKADTALQSSSIAEGSTNGTIAVSGTDIAVHGLGSAAYTASTAYDTAGSAAAVQGQSGDAASAATVYGAKAYADSLASNYDAAGTAASAASAAETAAKSYADGLLSWETYSAS